MKMDIQLSQAVESDCEFLWNVHCAAIKPAMAQTPGWDEEFQHRYFVEHFSPSRNQMISYQGKTAGVLSVEECPREIILSNIELLPEFQGLGIGTSLIRGLLERGDASGKPVSLRVLKTNPAVNLYKRLGFTVISETNSHYWMRKEGQPIEFIPARWETARCFMIEASPSNRESLVLIFNENPSLCEAVCEGYTPEKLTSDLMDHHFLPAGGVAWREKIFLVRGLESRDTAGFMVIYFGYPTPDTLYIRTIYLRPNHQGSGIGREILKALTQYAIEAGFKESRVVVGLKDWGALRFWTGQGYGRITKLKGDAQFSETAQANVELMKSFLAQPEK